MDLYEELREKLRIIMEEHELQDENLVITTQALTPEEAIGITTRKDFPILNGKEVLVEANFRNAKGQVYTDQPSALTITVQEMMKMDLSDSRNRVLFIAGLNAILAGLGLIQHTVHCKNEELELCSKEIMDELVQNYGANKNVALVGLQPALLERLQEKFKVRVLDLNINTIGIEKYGVIVEDGSKDKKIVLDWADIILVTGSTLGNGTIIEYLKIEEKPVIFYGTTVAGAAYLKGLKQLCPYSK